MPAGPGAVTVAKEQLVAMNSLQGRETARAMCSSVIDTVFSNKFLFKNYYYYHYSLLLFKAGSKSRAQTGFHGPASG